MTSMQPNKILLELQNVLARLAAPASEQISYLQKLKVLPSIDELALEFDDTFVLVPQLIDERQLTQEQAETMYALDRKLSEMSNEQSLWTTTALREHPDWAEVRRLAAIGVHKMSRPILNSATP